jgi:hypothetical protein
MALLEQQVQAVGKATKANSVLQGGGASSAVRLMGMVVLLVMVQPGRVVQRDGRGLPAGLTYFTSLA